MAPAPTSSRSHAETASAAHLHARDLLRPPDGVSGRRCRYANRRFPNAAVPGGDRAPGSAPSLRRVIVAVVEAGVDGKHPDLARRIVGAHRFGGSDPLFPTSPHGTAVAGLIAAIDGNKQGIDGIAPNARLLVAGTSFDALSIAHAIRWAVDRHARVINLWLAGLRPVPGYEEAVDYTLAQARSSSRRPGTASTGTSRVARPRRRAGACLATARADRRRGGRSKDRHRASRSPTHAGSISPRPASSSRRSGRHGTTHTPRRPTVPFSAPRAAIRPAGPRTQHGARAGPRSRRRWSRPQPRSCSAPTHASVPSKSRHCSGKRLGRSPIRDTKAGPESSTSRRPSIASARERFHTRITPSQTIELPPRLEFRLEESGRRSTGKTTPSTSTE